MHKILSILFGIVAMCGMAQNPNQKIYMRYGDGKSNTLIVTNGAYFASVDDLYTVTTNMNAVLVPITNDIFGIKFEMSVVTQKIGHIEQEIELTDVYSGTNVVGYVLGSQTNKVIQPAGLQPDMSAYMPKTGGTFSGPVTVSSSFSSGEYTTSSGYSSHAEGSGTEASGGYSHAEGGGTTSSGGYSHAEGTGTEAIGDYSHTEGGGTRAAGYSSHAEGEGTRATGGSSHAEGSGTEASGYYSHAEGGGTEASGYYSHAEGTSTKAIGSSSHAEGTSTEASGYYSHAEGEGTRATGDSSHAEGSGTEASGYYSHAEGIKSLATNNTSFVWQGFQGEPWSDYDPDSAPGYGSHGDGTFNIAPVGGARGVWIGHTTLYSIVYESEIVKSKTSSGEPLPNVFVIKDLSDNSFSLVEITQ